MKTVTNLVEYVQTELQDPRTVMFNRTKSQLFLLVTMALLFVQLGLVLTLP
jgi:hypothetical protein